MDILNSCQNLLHEGDGFLLIQSFFPDNIVKKLAPWCILHDEVNIGFSFDNLSLKTDCTSYNWTILGCLSILSMQIYRVTLSMSACSTIFYFCRVLTATFISVGICVPRRTFPKVPSPIVWPWMSIFDTYSVIADDELSLSCCRHQLNLYYYLNLYVITSIFKIQNIKTKQSFTLFNRSDGLLSFCLKLSWNKKGCRTTIVCIFDCGCHSDVSGVSGFRTQTSII